MPAIKRVRAASRKRHAFYYCYPNTWHEWTRSQSLRTTMPLPHKAPATIAHCSSRTRTPPRSRCPAHCCYRSRTATAPSTATAIATATPLRRTGIQNSQQARAPKSSTRSTSARGARGARADRRPQIRTPRSSQHRATPAFPRLAASATPKLHDEPSVDRAPPLRATASPATGRAARARRPSSCRIKRRRAPQRRRPSHRLSRTHSLVHFGRHVTANLYQFLKERMRYAR